MRMRVLGCAGGSALTRAMSCYLFDDVFAIDAGALTTSLEIAEQRAIDAVALTHAHLDHVWSFPLFMANRYTGPSRTCQVYGSTIALDAIRTDLFNGRVWPDLLAVPLENGQPSATLNAVDPDGTARVLDRFEIRAIPLVHAVPSQGYVVRVRDRAAIVCGDTSPAERLWRVANETEGLRGLVLECSYPDSMAEMAQKTGHLTPATFGAEIAKLKADIPVYVTHIKPECHKAVVEGLRALRDARVRILEDGQHIEF